MDIDPKITGTAARNSVLMDPNLAGHLLNLAKNSEQDGIGKLSCMAMTNKFTKPAKLTFVVAICNNYVQAATMTFVVTHLRTNKTNSNIHMNRKEKGVGGGHVPQSIKVSFISLHPASNLPNKVFRVLDALQHHVGLVGAPLDPRDHGSTLLR